MPGRFRRDGCGNFKCRLCGPNGDEIKRWRKRVEAREVAVEIEYERREYASGRREAAGTMLGLLSGPSGLRVG